LCEEDTYGKAPFIWPEKVQSAWPDDLSFLLAKGSFLKMSVLTIPNSVANGGSERCRRFRIISENSAYKMRKKVKVT